MAYVKPSVQSLEGKLIVIANAFAGVWAVLEFINQTNVFASNPQIAGYFAGALTVMNTAFIIGRSWVKKAAVLLSDTEARKDGIIAPSGRVPVQDVEI